jgi:hypothetical protein
VSTPVFTCKPGATTPTEYKLARGEYAGGPVATFVSEWEARKLARVDRYGR